MFPFTTRSSSEQDELEERQVIKKTTLKLAGFPRDNVIVKGWELRHFHKPHRYINQYY